MTSTQINTALVRFESAVFAGQPEWNTKEEYLAYESWMSERKAISNNFKAALVANQKEEAKNIVRIAQRKFNIVINFSD